jgi:hypothetical protein
MIFDLCFAWLGDLQSLREKLYGVNAEKNHFMGIGDGL